MGVNFIFNQKSKAKETCYLHVQFGGRSVHSWQLRMFFFGLPERHCKGCQITPDPPGYRTDPTGRSPLTFFIRVRYDTTFTCSHLAADNNNGRPCLDLEGTRWKYSTVFHCCRFDGGFPVSTCWTFKLNASYCSLNRDRSIRNSAFTKFKKKSLYLVS